MKKRGKREKGKKEHRRNQIIEDELKKLQYVKDVDECEFENRIITILNKNILHAKDLNELNFPYYAKSGPKGGKFITNICLNYLNMQ